MNYKRSVTSTWVGSKNRFLNSLVWVTVTGQEAQQDGRLVDVLPCTDFGNARLVFFCELGVRIGVERHQTLCCINRTYRVNCYRNAPLSRFKSWTGHGCADVTDVWAFRSAVTVVRWANLHFQQQIKAWGRSQLHVASAPPLPYQPVLPVGVLIGFPVEVLSHTHTPNPHNTCPHHHYTHTHAWLAPLWYPECMQIRIWLISFFQDFLQCVPDVVTGLTSAEARMHRALDVWGHICPL